MVQITSRSIKNSFRYALRGLLHTFRTQQSFRLQVVATGLVVLLMVMLQVTTRDAIILITMLAAVLTLELINTVVEHITDLLSAKLTAVAKFAKDAMAAAVLFASLVAIVIGCLVFWPYVR
ncbi:MAG: diacylglycerol kinase family protein [Patescibacteria group bacterium]